MYETPSQEIFDEMKKIATELWNTYEKAEDERISRDEYEDEEVSECCGATINDFGLCSDCKEYSEAYKD